MKKIVLILFSFISIGIYGQSTINSYTSTLRFLNSDFLQTYQGARIAVRTMTLPNSLNTYTSTVGFNNTDNAQIYQAIRGIGGAISSLTTSIPSSTLFWGINGNEPTTNTNFIGTTNNTSLIFRTNNAQRFKIDSLGCLGVNKALPTATLDVTGTMSVSGTSTLTGLLNNGTLNVTSTSTLTGLRNNGTFTTTSTAMIGGTSAGSATLHVLGTASVSGSSTLTGVQINGNAVLTGSLGSTSKTAGIGYAVGSGSTVTQGTSRTTGVTINAVAGSITLFSTAGSATYQDFTVTNSAVGINDIIVINQRSGTDRYVIEVTAVAAGSFRVTFATTGGTTVESPVFNYAIIKGQTN